MPSIKLENVSLEFPGIVRKRGMHITSSKSATAPGGKMKLDNKDRLNVRALDNISLEIKAGDRVALVGHNGAGKSTLLRAMAGLYQPTMGSLQVEGKIAPLFNLNFGIDAEASGFENILIRGLFLGMSKAEVEGKMNIIAEFCELGDFLHLPVRTYSSGMSARLGFAISTHIDAEILLLDEAIGTGDAAFFKKACIQIENFVNNANIMVLASHSNRILRQFCQKGVLLEHGKAVISGPLDDVLHGYRDLQKKVVSVGLGAAEYQVQAKDSIDNHVITTRKQDKDISVLVLNDNNDYSPNPGSRLVRNALDVLLSPIIGENSSWDYIPGHYWVKSFGHLGCDKQERFNITPGAFLSYAKTVQPLDVNEWERIRLELSETDSYIVHKFNSADIILVNGSNCMHHNIPRALAILALVKTAATLGAKVILANTTIQMMDFELLKNVLPLIDMIHVRDSASQVYLDKLGFKSVCTTDVAFLGLKESRETRVRYLNSEEYVLVTGGVAIDGRSLTSLFEGVREYGMRPVYLCVGDAGEEDIIAPVCDQYGVPVVFVKEMEFDELVKFLSQFQIAISGRHYINILLMNAGVPFVALPSDTWVIEETCKLLDYPIPVITEYKQVCEGLKKIKVDHDQLVLQSEMAVAQGERSSLTLQKELATFMKRTLFNGALCRPS